MELSIMQINCYVVKEDNAPDTFIKQSSTHGLGLFASKAFDRDEVILDYTPFKISFYVIEWNKLAPDQYNKNWLIPINERFCLTNDKSNKLHFINHSRNPNCNWFIKDYIITAARNINKGEELFIDYRLEIRPNRACFPDWV